MVPTKDASTIRIGSSQISSEDKEQRVISLTCLKLGAQEVTVLVSTELGVQYPVQLSKTFVFSCQVPHSVYFHPIATPEKTATIPHDCIDCMFPSSSCRFLGFLVVFLVLLADWY